MNASEITKYQATVYHGGTLHGLGIWAVGKRWRDAERAQAEGDRLARQCRQVAGGSPVIEVKNA